MSDVMVASKSTVRRWIEKIADATGQEITKSHAQELALTLRQVGEGGVVGVVLGAVDAEVGLDVRGVPVDLVTTALGTASAMYFAKEDFAHDLRNAGSHSFAIFTFRKTRDLLKRKGQPGLDDSDAIDSSGASSTDDVGKEDPVVETARDL